VATRIIHFGVDPSGSILAALAANGYEVAVCGTSIPKLKQMLQQRDVDALAVTENDAPQAFDLFTPVRSIRKVPLILFQDGTGTSDTSQFDLAIHNDAPLPDLLDRIAALIERSRSLRAELRMSREQRHLLIAESASLRQEAATARVESQRIQAKLGDVKGERLSIRSILVVDDYARWRETMCSLLRDYADCRVISEAEDGVEAVKKASELKPQLILLDLDLPRQNGIQAARQNSKIESRLRHSFREHEHRRRYSTRGAEYGCEGLPVKSRCSF